MAEPRRATSVSAVACEHGTLTIRLHDESGAIFAHASLDKASAIAFLDEASATLERALLSGMACEGHA